LEVDKVKMLDKKGQMGGIMSGLQAFIMGIAGVTIVLVVVFIILANLKSSTTDTNATTAIGTIQTKLQDVPTWIGIIIVVAMAFIVLGFFYFGKGKGGSY
jgi:heme/copper-type cytochrome/quinol oxidase subunit 2